MWVILRGFALRGSDSYLGTGHPALQTASPHAMPRGEDTWPTIQIVDNLAYPRFAADIFATCGYPDSARRRKGEGQTLGTCALAEYWPARDALRKKLRDSAAGYCQAGTVYPATSREARQQAFGASFWAFLQSGAQPESGAALQVWFGHQKVLFFLLANNYFGAAGFPREVATTAIAGSWPALGWGGARGQAIREAQGAPLFRALVQDAAAPYARATRPPSTARWLVMFVENSLACLLDISGEPLSE